LQHEPRTPPPTPPDTSISSSSLSLSLSYSRTKKFAKKQLGFESLSLSTLTLTLSLSLSLSLYLSLSIPPLFFWVEGFLTLFEEKNGSYIYPRIWGGGILYLLIGVRTLNPIALNVHEKNLIKRDVSHNFLFSSQFLLASSKYFNLI